MTAPTLKRLLAASLMLCLGSLPALAARKPPVHQPPVQWTLGSVPEIAKAGSRFTVVLHGTIEAGWHLYALQEPDGGPVATEVSLAEDGPIRLLRVDQSRPRTVADPVFQVPTAFFADNVDFTLHLQSAPSTKRGPQTVQVLVRYQSCNERVCLPPRIDAIDLPLTAGR